MRRQVAEAEVVLGGRGVAPPRLQQRRHVRAELAPDAGRRRRSCSTNSSSELAGHRMRHRDVARQDVVERRDVRRALDVRVAAQREDAAAGAPDVAEQQLDDRRGADVLDAGRVLRPADRVTDRRRALAARVVAQRLGDREEPLARHAADLAPPSPACSARSGGAGPGRRSAGARASRSLLGRLAVLELHPVRAVRLVARHVAGLLALARGQLALDARVVPACRPRTAPSSAFQPREQAVEVLRRRGTPP